jgi:vacuolar protein sorting-associated protein 54
MFNFRHLGSQLAELENLIEKMLQDDFAKCISADLNRPLSDDIPLLEEVTYYYLLQRSNQFSLPEQLSNIICG